MKNKTAPWVRVGILIFGILGISILAKKFTGSILPSEPEQALIFQNALLLLVLGTSLLESYYTKPADSVVNSLMGMITLLTVHGVAPVLPWMLVFGYCLMVFAISITCVSVSSSKSNFGWRKKLSSLTYRPSVVFGRARLLFTIVFLSGLYFFYDVQDKITLALVVYWGVFLSLWPLKIPELLTSWLSTESMSSKDGGSIVRVDNPNIVRVSANAFAEWSPENPKICVLPNGEMFWLQPLFSHFQDNMLFATGLLTSLPVYNCSARVSKIVNPTVRNDVPTRVEMIQALGGTETSVLLGFVVERSEVGVLRVEVLNDMKCHNGMILWANISGDNTYFQVVDGVTNEESFSGDLHGHHVATAVQLGTLEEGAGFHKVDWLPPMNGAVFTSNPSDPVSVKGVRDDDFVIGVIPNSNIEIGGNFNEDYNYHTAILGVTGSGKTEQAFDLIRHSVRKNMKVVCIDLTAQYSLRLADENPVDLSLSDVLADELSQKLFDVETGNYGAGAEKQALKEFSSRMKTEVLTRIENFLLGDVDSDLALIQLTEISNSKATLWITELYMTCLLKFARDNPETCPKILIVVEEAHTVMPEPSTMGLGDFDSRGLVSKISQIALQGRKYGVGLLILAQRTATVSKTVLTQCNTVISFTCYDETSLGFLKNIYSEKHVSLIPNLPIRHAICFGKWIRTERPVVVEIPYDESKQ